MVVKSKRGRRRYIAFRVRGGEALSDEDLLSALNPSFASAKLKPPKVIQFDGSMGIVRVGGGEYRKAVDLINSGGEGALETLRASGTLRTLRERYFPAPRRPGRRA
ncbi:hypothetical protein [Methanomassiliicoccus luminyensis]|jgi:RNase P/RNase MRP subunit POP5|uniref:hypothetical protein n=1 Tax=Methanomassiliicoccus luminyensis TaxID=1080712 RepID=UPI00036AA196|nr:hypothetical protein [Methanomassiliicoccus luminyensis]